MHYYVQNASKSWNKVTIHSYANTIKESFETFDTYCAQTFYNYRKFQCMRVAEQNKAKLFRRLSTCAFRHIGAPYASLNTRNLVYYWLTANEIGDKKCLFLSRKSLFEVKRLESDIQHPSLPNLKKKVRWEIVNFTKLLWCW